MFLKIEKMAGSFGSAGQRGEYSQAIGRTEIHEISLEDQFITCLYPTFSGAILVLTVLKERIHLIVIN